MRDEAADSNRKTQYETNPGTSVTEVPIQLTPPPRWAEPYPYLLLEDVPFHVRYTRTVTPEAPLPQHTFGQGKIISGKELRNSLYGELSFWLSCKAWITKAGTVFYLYRSGIGDTLTRFDPDHSSGRLITRPELQITADAYQITGPDRIPHLWSPAAIRDAVTHELRPGPFDWPEGWAHIMPGGTVRFSPRRCPWERPVEYIAVPVSAPQSWGPACAECGWVQADHSRPAGYIGPRCSEFRFPA